MPLRSGCWILLMRETKSPVLSPSGARRLRDVLTVLTEVVGLTSKMLPPPPQMLPQGHAHIPDLLILKNKNSQHLLKNVHHVLGT